MMIITYVNVNVMPEIVSGINFDAIANKKVSSQTKKMLRE